MPANAAGRPYLDERAMKNILLFLRTAFLALLLAGACISTAQAGPSCNGNAGNLVFGTVSLLAGGITDSSSTISYGCSSSPGTQVLVCFSMGPDPSTASYDPRTLPSDSNNGSRMAFNLYSDAARSTIWGKTGASYAPVPVIMSFGAGEYYKTSTLTLYGRIKAAGQQGLPAGYYSTNGIGGWPMIMSYKDVTGVPSPNCSGSGMTTSTSTYYIQAIVQSECQLGQITTMDFGTVFQNLTQNVDSTATITVTCNGGQGANGYHVGLGDGLNSASGQRRLQGPGGYLNYELYRDAQRTSRWGNSSGYNDVSGVGNGQPQVLTVYGRVPAQSTPGVGTFTDTVVVTITY